MSYRTTARKPAGAYAEMRSDEEYDSQSRPKKQREREIPLQPGTEHRRRFGLDPKLSKKLFDSYYYWTLAAMQYIIDNETQILHDFERAPIHDSSSTTPKGSRRKYYDDDSRIKSILEYGTDKFDQLPLEIKDELIVYSFKQWNKLMYQKRNGLPQSRYRIPTPFGYQDPTLFPIKPHKKANFRPFDFVVESLIQDNDSPEYPATDLPTPASPGSQNRPPSAGSSPSRSMSPLQRLSRSPLAHASRHSSPGLGGPASLHSMSHSPALRSPSVHPSRHSSPGLAGPASLHSMSHSSPLRSPSVHPSRHSSPGLGGPASLHSTSHSPALRSPSVHASRHSSPGLGGPASFHRMSHSPALRSPSNHLDNAWQRSSSQPAVTYPYKGNTYSPLSTQLHHEPGPEHSLQSRSYPMFTPNYENYAFNPDMHLGHPYHVESHSPGSPGSSLSMSPYISSHLSGFPGSNLSTPPYLSSYQSLSQVDEPMRSPSPPKSPINLAKEFEEPSQETGIDWDEFMKTSPRPTPKRDSMSPGPDRHSWPSSPGNTNSSHTRRLDDILNSVHQPPGLLEQHMRKPNSFWNWD